MDIKARRESMRRSASNLPRTQAKDRGCPAYLHIVCVCTLISSFRTLEQTSALNRTRIKLSNASAPTRALILALFATVSAILSNFAWFLGFRWSLNPLLPGIFFGMVLSLAIWLWVSRSAFKLGSLY